MGMTKWEYDIRFVFNLKEALKTQGLEGWELVAVIGDDFIFKRPIEENE